MSEVLSKFSCDHIPEGDSCGLVVTLAEQNAKLRELARGLGQCAQGVDCEDCLLYDLSEPDHCREERLSRELGIVARMTHEDRVWHHEMETLEGIHEHAERIASLEELVLDMWAQLLNAYDEKELYEFAERMAELKIEEGH